MLGVTRSHPEERPCRPVDLAFAKDAAPGSRRTGTRADFGHGTRRLRPIDHRGGFGRDRGCGQRRRSAPRRGAARRERRGCARYRSGRCQWGVRLGEQFGGAEQLHGNGRRRGPLKWRTSNHPDHSDRMHQEGDCGGPDQHTSRSRSRSAWEGRERQSERRFEGCRPKRRSPRSRRRRRPPCGRYRPVDREARHGPPPPFILDELAPGARPGGKIRRRSTVDRAEARALPAASPREKFARTPCRTEGALPHGIRSPHFLVANCRDVHPELDERPLDRSRRFGMDLASLLG